MANCNIITLKGTSSISNDRIIINENFKNLIGCLKELQSLVDSGNIDINSNSVSNDSNVPGNTVTNALNNLLSSMSTSNSVTLVDLLDDLPYIGSSGDLCFVRDITAKTTPISALYIYDTEWKQLIREDSNTYITDLNDAIESPGLNIIGATVADIKGKTFSDFIDIYVFPTVAASISANESANIVYAGASSTVEVGTTLDVTLTATFNRGSIQNGDGSSGPLLVGLPNQYEFSGPGISVPVVITSTNLSEILTTANTGMSTVLAIFGSQNWGIDIDYDAGSGTYLDSKGNVANNLDGSRVSGNDTDDTPNITGRYYVFYDTGSIVSNSAQVRNSSGKVFLSASNTGSFTINIPLNTAEVYFSVPTGKSVQVNYVQSSNADVTGSFASSTFNVDDASGSAVSYDTWRSTIGGGGYPANATYNVVIS